jgi:hypothetical protein
VVAASRLSKRYSSEVMVAGSVPRVSAVVVMVRPMARCRRTASASGAGTSWYRVRAGVAAVRAVWWTRWARVLQAMAVVRWPASACLQEIARSPSARWTARVAASWSTTRWRA